MIQGHFDRVDGLYVHGWAFNPENPEERVEVVVLVDGKPVAEGVADQFREDLKEAGIGDGGYAFVIKLPNEIADGKEHEIRVVVKNTGNDLENSPQIVIFQQLEDSYIGHLDSVDGLLVTGWTYNKANPEERVEVVVLVDGKPVAEGVADQYREDLKQDGIGDGKHAFKIKLPDELADGEVHEIKVVVNSYPNFKVELAEKKYICIKSDIIFDEEFYLEQARRKDILVNETPILHYLKNGWKLGLDPHPLFDTWYYYEVNNPSREVCPLVSYLLDRKFFQCSPFVDEAYLNHMLHINKISPDKTLRNLAFAIKQGLPPSFLHPHIFDPVISFLRMNLSLAIDYTDILDVIKTKPSIEDLIVLLRFLRSQRIYNFSDDESPIISVVILNYKKPIMTILSALSVLIALKDVPHEIIIVDNESDRFFTEILYRYLQKQKNVKIIASKNNLFFGEGNNIAIDRVQGRYVLFLNNDAFIGPNIKYLLDILEEKEDIGAASPIIINQDFRISEVGGIVSPLGDVLQIGKFMNFEKTLWNSLNNMAFIEVDYASAACLMVRAEILKKYGGFDYIYEPFYYEDTDLCLRIKCLGYKIVCIPKAISLHIENFTTKEFLKDKWGTVVQNSKEKFFNRWVFKNKEYKPVEIKYSQRKKRKTIALYTPFPITIGGGENYFLSMGAALSKIANIVFITEEYTSRTRISFVCRDLGIEQFEFEVMKRNEVGKYYFDLAIVMGNEIVPSWIPPAQKIIYLCQFPFPLYHVKYHDFSSYDKIDLYIAYSFFVKENIQKEIEKYSLPEKPIEVIYPPSNLPNYTVDEILEKKLRNKNKKMFISIGRFQSHGHNKRQDVIAKILSEASTKLPIEGYIFGGLRESPEDKEFFQKVRSYQNKGVLLVKANVDRDTIESHLLRSHFYIHATGLGINPGVEPYKCEHFGITLVEAMAYGCIPLAYKCGGPKEILESHNVGYVFSSEDELKNLVFDLIEMDIESEEYWITVEKCMKVAENFSRENFYKKVSNIIEKLMSTSNFNGLL
ncbi:glycosyltransferase [Thermosulfurimonas dismutans]|uniref:Glycosyltransferase n=1 Tax=Thermosulfurimonas dismutans TaxID=999894 RepID=A0A179D1E7_9BACT|nr:glycosyltransferase [Thermosulfurimonas dismutans]OAQ19870.1 hypothetical protein TDIS_2050 [Thermosulfurimonas dismutans]